MDLPFSQACENNKTYIQQAISGFLTPQQTLLEIGSYTGQHAEFIGKNLNLKWQTSDILENTWILTEKAKDPNNPITGKPLIIEIGDIPLKSQVPLNYENIYTANTLHIMSAKNVEIFCSTIHSILNPAGLLFIYGPFKFDNKFTSDSNSHFDQSLKQRNPASGIRDFEMIEKSLKAANLDFIEKFDLPANNHLLVFKKN
jgi:cyclopropane fatty-acyl-phospholipid synthase-like methyltransferase